MLSDRGFFIEIELARLGAKLIMPPFLKNRTKYTAEETRQTQLIAKAGLFFSSSFNPLTSHSYPRKMVDFHHCFCSGYLSTISLKKMRECIESLSFLCTLSPCPRKMIDFHHCICSSYLSTHFPERNERAYLGIS